MKKKVLGLLFLAIMLVLSACSASEDASESKDSYNQDMSDGESSNEIATEEMENVANDSSQTSDSDETAEASAEGAVVSTNRMIIHQASLSVNVKELDKAQATIEQKVAHYGGYIVESNVYKEDDQTSSGKMVVRIPEKHFEKFLADAEGQVAKVLERNVTGQDVTEQYVDLQSRVKSKRAVEERLLAFMSKAQKTEDLLKISADLAKVQEEIEVMVGKMKYLENQTSFSTVELLMYENKVVVPEIESKELNTWEKTKKQLATSTNSLLATGSALIVFFIGNLPVLLILTLIGFGVYWFVRKKLRHVKK